MCKQHKAYIYSIIIVTIARCFEYTYNSTNSDDNVVQLSIRFERLLVTGKLRQSRQCDRYA